MVFSIILVFFLGTCNHVYVDPYVNSTLTKRENFLSSALHAFGLSICMIKSTNSCCTFMAVNRSCLHIFSLGETADL